MNHMGQELSGKEVSNIFESFPHRKETEMVQLLLSGPLRYACKDSDCDDGKKVEKRGRGRRRNSGK
jgi:hypothetical protein